MSRLDRSETTPLPLNTIEALAMIYLPVFLVMEQGNLVILSTLPEAETYSFSPQPSEPNFTFEEVLPTEIAMSPSSCCTF